MSELDRIITGDCVDVLPLVDEPAAKAKGDSQKPLLADGP